MTDVTGLREALLAGPVVLDGGLATHLEARGHDLTGDLWSARLLRDDPAAVRDAHEDYLRAGAQVVVSASYQASAQGFARLGLGPQQSSALVARSVEVAREAVERVGRPAWVAGSVGPYGAVLAGGQEYTGEYLDPGHDGGRPLTVAGLRAFHRERMSVLADAGADVLALETVPALAEVEALLLAAGDVGAPVWLSLTTVVGEDAVVRTRRGEPAEEAFAMARDVPEVLAVGVNCCDPSGVAAAVPVAAAASGLPVVVYPNSGEVWDGAARRWTGRPDLDLAAAQGWVDAGARLVGGCCRVGPEQVAALAHGLAHGPAHGPGVSRPC
ncbi:homocysteine S-methyltransferase [Aquipuribacter sp. MA13-6]|uniref:homocysteine S-methyltransferase n=1 Tax=unclassified Aquipuribacter TaxID=2635084 RepID=UPI003EEB8F5B